MNIFYRRPLCVFCLIFMVTSVVSIYMGWKEKLWGLAVLALAVLVAIILMRPLSNKRIVLLSLILCLIAVMCSLINTWLRIDITKSNAQKYYGERTLEMDITDIDRQSAYSSAYDVTVQNIDGDDVKIKAVAIFCFSTDISVGDTVLANAEVSSRDDGEQLLTVTVYRPDDGFVRRFDRSGGFFSTLLKPEGWRVIVWQMRQWVSDRLDRYLGADSAISKAFLLGDTSEVDTNIIRDFRRTGVSHLFAVSGLHISVLSGAVELLLRKLYVPRRMRGMTVSVLAFLLLCLSGFTMSAMRSVIMFWMVYIAFIVSEDNDPITTLFLAVTLILGVFPFAVYEIGLWMSFLATLGLLTVYPYMEKRIPRADFIKGIKGYALRFLRSCLLVAAMTVVSNMFLLPISWGVFGEFSLVSVPTNILLSPLNTAYLIMTTTILALGGVPIVGDALAVGIRAVSYVTVEITEFFSEIEGATVSLRYPFAKYLILSFAVIMCVMLVVKFKRKWIMAIPPVALCAVFVLSMWIFHTTQKASVKYYGEKTSEVITVCDGRDVGIVDLSAGRYSQMAYAIRDAMKNGATDVDTLVLTTVSSTHISTMEYLFRSTLIETVYLPKPNNSKAIELSIKLVEFANACGVEAVLYSGGDIIKLCRESHVLADFAYNDNKRAVSLIFSGGGNVLGYVDAFSFGTDMQNTVNYRLSACDTVIVGNNGIPEQRYSYTVRPDARVIYVSKSLAEMSDIETDINNCYYSKEDNTELEFLME